MPGPRRVVVTGTGVVTPIGHDVPSFWSALKEGRSGVGPLRDIDFEEKYRHSCHRPHAALHPRGPRRHWYRRRLRVRPDILCCAHAPYNST
jgi:3-oxoacyl-(acyl-carrier-protein) synthase